VAGPLAAAPPCPLCAAVFITKGCRDESIGSHSWSADDVRTAAGRRQLMLPGTATHSLPAPGRDQLRILVVVGMAEK
jgi:hypothetical protein